MKVSDQQSLRVRMLGLSSQNEEIVKHGGDSGKSQKHL